MKLFMNAILVNNLIIIAKFVIIMDIALNVKLIIILYNQIINVYKIVKALN